MYTVYGGKLKLLLDAAEPQNEKRKINVSNLNLQTWCF